MEVRKKSIVLPGVALMESPSFERDRASTSSSTIVRSSEQDLSLDAIDGVHNIDIDDDDYEEIAKTTQNAAPTLITTAPGQHQKYRVLGTTSLIGIVFFASCGGPVGSEPIISAGGPLLGLLGIGVYVLCVQLPFYLTVTKLCCSFPENGGYSVWANAAFGPFWGFQIGYWSWIGFALNNAVYPGFIYTMVTDAFNVKATSSTIAFCVKVTIAIVLALPSYLGVRFVGFGAVTVMIVVCVTTMIFTIWGFAVSDIAWFRLTEVRGPNDVTHEPAHAGIDWSLLIHALFWSFDGVYNISVIGGEVINPVRTYPRVILAAICLAVVTYVLPWISAVSSNKSSWLRFAEDTYPNVAEAIGGPTLSHIIVASSVLSVIARFTCALFFQSFLVQGMAQSQLLPSLLRKRSARFKTPQYAVLCSLLVTLALMAFDVESIINMANAYSGAVQIIIIASMLQLRRSLPHLPRPVGVQGNTTKIAIMLVPATALFVYVIVTTLMEWKLAVVVFGFAVPGVIYSLIRRRMAGRTCCC